MKTATDAPVEACNVSYEQVADHFGVTVETVKFWRKHGRGPRGYRIGKYVRFKWSEVLEWEQQQHEALRAS